MDESQYDPWWGRVKDAAQQILGKIQGDISIGGGKPASAQLSVGENRVMSVAALVIVLLLGILIGSRRC